MHSIPDIDMSRITPAHLAAGLRWYFKTSHEQWKLGDYEAAQLLRADLSTLEQWRSKLLAENSIELEPEVAERLSLLIEIYGDIRRICPQYSAVAAAKVFTDRNLNLLFEGLSPKDYILRDNSLSTLRRVRNHFRGLVAQINH